jgi:ParB-like chromosome segregation protein Spo0J
MLSAVVVGCGARRLQAAQKVRDLKVVGLVDIDEARARARAAEFGLTEAAIGVNLKAILAAVRPDMLFDDVAPQARRNVAVIALAAGCHVLTEKPQAASMEDARVILEAARRHNRLHAVAQMRTPGFGDSDWARITSELRLAGFTGAIDIEGRHDPVYREDLEMTGQVRAVNDLKDCRGGPRFIGASA